jgi:hypothetical protein
MKKARYAPVLQDQQGVSNRACCCRSSIFFTFTQAPGAPLSLLCSFSARRSSPTSYAVVTPPSAADLLRTRMVAATWSSQQPSIGSDLAHLGHVHRAQGMGGKARRLLSARHPSLPRRLSCGRTASPIAHQQPSPRSFYAPRPSAPSSAAFPPRHLLRDMLWGGECSRFFGRS